MKPASFQISPRPLESGRRGRLLPLLVLATLVLLFLAEPICRYRSSHYCFADFTQSFSLIDVEPGHDPENRMMGDPAVIYLPWAILNRDAVREGRFPAWNPYNGGGVPHLANYQSGVLSPYNLPFYLLDLKTALLASAFLKLYAIAAFTFLFLHARGLSRIASVAGASAFTFAGYHVVWLSGAITATAATLPASLTEIVAEEPTRSELEVTRAEPGYLVIAKPHYPGWNATVDGRPRPLLRANYAFMAVEVPAGSHQVTLRYESASIRWGSAISLTTALAGCVWLGWRIRRRR